MRLTTFLALGAIVGVDLESPKDPRRRNKNQKAQNQRQAKQCVQKEWAYPARGGRLTQITTHLSKICKGYIDRPTYQCRCLKRQRTLFWSLVKARRVCISRKRDAQTQSDKKQRKAEKNSNKSRTRRQNDDLSEDFDDSDDFDEDTDVLDSTASETLLAESDLAEAIEAGGELTDTLMDDLINEQCVVDTDDSEDAQEECADLRQAAEDLHNSGSDEETEEAKERADIIFRIIRMHRAMGNWAMTYVAEGPYCDKQQKLSKRIVKNRRRMQRKRKNYPTNPTKLKKQRQAERAKEQAKKEREEAKEEASLLAGSE